MPRRRSSNNVLTFRGTAKKDPKRYADRKNAPVPTDPLGDPPAYFNDGEREAWATIARTAPDRVLFRRDEIIVAMAARLWASIIARPQHKVRAAEVARMESMLSRLGMTPSDASRVAATQPPEANEFDDIPPRRR